MGGAKLQAGQTRSGLVPVASQERAGDSTALAIGLLRFLLLLVSRLARLLEGEFRAEGGN